MDLTPNQGPDDIERHPCPKCTAPAGSPCRTRAGKAAGKDHTARFVLVPALREELAVVEPADRHPGKAWTQGPCVDPATQEHPGRPFRVGYARCSVATQELASQIDALKHVECRRIFSEKIGTRIKIRPELQNAIQLARDIKEAASTKGSSSPSTR